MVINAMQSDLLSDHESNLYIYRCTIAYDGSAYAGWQEQPDVVTIQQMLQKHFKRVFNNQVQIYAASRTDAGVHALGQVLLCKTSLDVAPERLCKAWNNALPDDIVIREVTRANPHFNPRTSVLYKIYHYYLFQERPMPFMQRYGWYVRYPINLEKLAAALRFFEGTKDFRSFCTGESYSAGTQRTIIEFSCKIIGEFNAIQISCIGERFMRHMVRRLVGAAVAYATHSDMSLDELGSVLAACNPAHNLPTAPASGLVLYKIVYREDVEKVQDIT